MTAALTAQHWVNMARATTDANRARVYAMWAAAASFPRAGKNPFDAEREPELHEQWAWFAEMKKLPRVVTTSPAMAEISGAELVEGA